MTTKGTIEHGFSLVEISLALLVVSIGLLSIIGLFPASLDMSKRAINETYAAFLVDSAFTSYREAAQHIPWNELDSYMPIAPNTIGTSAGSVNSDVFWDDSESLRMIPDGAVNTLVYSAGSAAEKWAGNNWILPDSWSMEDHALRYRLRVADAPGEPNIKRMEMEVWMGQYGDETQEKPEVFYGEIYRHTYVP